MQHLPADADEGEAEAEAAELGVEEGKAQAEGRGLVGFQSDAFVAVVVIGSVVVGDVDEDEARGGRVKQRDEVDGKGIVEGIVDGEVCRRGNERTL